MAEQMRRLRVNQPEASFIIPISANGKYTEANYMFTLLSIDADVILSTGVFAVSFVRKKFAFDRTGKLTIHLRFAMFLDQIHNEQPSNAPSAVLSSTRVNGVWLMWTHRARNSKAESTSVTCQYHSGMAGRFSAA